MPGPTEGRAISHSRRLPTLPPDQVADCCARHRRGGFFQPVERRAAATIASIWVCPVLDQDLDGLQEACLGGVVQRCCAQSPDAGRTFLTAASAIVGAGTVAQERAHVLRIVPATLVSRAAGTDP